jgi:hypothetical protein
VSFAGRALAGMGEAFARRAGVLLDPLVRGLTSQAERVDELVVGNGSRDPWRDTFDLETTTIPAWLGQATGTPVPGGLTLEQQRAYVRERRAQKRGTPGAMRSAVRATLRGSQRVELSERDPDPDRVRVRVYSSEVTDLAATTAAAFGQKPVGLLLAVDVLAGATVAHMRDFHGPTVADYAAAFATVGDARDHVPEG